MKPIASMHRNRERQCAYQALRFFEDLARKMEHHRRIFGFLSTRRFVAEYSSPLRLEGTERDPPSLDSLFTIKSRRVFSRRWKIVLDIRFFPAEVRNLPVSWRVSLRTEKKKKRQIREFAVCDIYERQLVLPYVEMDINRFVREVIGEFSVRYLLVPAHDQRRTGRVLQPYTNWDRVELHPRARGL